MLGTKTIDNGKIIDWGKTSEDYAKYRPAPPRSLFEKLKLHGVGLENQKILDLGTGTGIMAREFAKNNAKVTGVDISRGQIEMAKKLMDEQDLKINFFASSVEDIDLEDNSFDIITANQCFLYFDKSVLIPKIKKILKPGGLFCMSHFSWMPTLDNTVFETEKLILKHNPDWSAFGYKGDITPGHKSLEKDFKIKAFFYYDEKIPFTHESWRGRIRASRGISASLNPKEVESFDREHQELLDKLVPNEFEVVHRLDAHILEVIK